jgi:hypothetical protein
MPIGRMSFILFLWTVLGFLGCLLTGSFDFFGQGSSSVSTMNSLINANVAANSSMVSQFLSFVDGGLTVLKALWAAMTFPITFLASPTNDFFSKLVFMIVFFPTIGGTAIAMLTTWVRGTNTPS